MKDFKLKFDEIVGDESGEEENKSDEEEDKNDEDETF